MNNTEVTIEQVEQFISMLTGGELENLILVEQPKLSKRAAFCVVYYLQEEMRIIPDTFEMCMDCEDIFDAQYGYIRQSDNAHICPDCASEYRYCIECGTLVPFDDDDDDDDVCQRCKKTDS